MKTVRLITFSFVFAAFFAISAFAQAQAPAKIALVDTDNFYAEKGGITKIANGYKSLEAEFKTATTDLENGFKRLQALGTELQTLQNRANDPNNKVPIDPNTARAKAKQYDELKTEMERKQEDLKKRFSSREVEVMSPIIQDIGNQLGEYAKQKGYTMMLDSSKLKNAQILIFSQDSTDVTKEFIQFYNTRPGGTATTKP